MDHEHVRIPHADTTGTTVITEVRWAHHDRCDSITLDGKMKPRSKERGTYSHAQKMRAAMTYVFGRLHGLGDMPWHRSEVTNKMLGNPSVSTQVSSYMCALRRRKVQMGEVAISARAITSDLLYKLYHYNHQPSHWDIHPYIPGAAVAQLQVPDQSHTGSPPGLHDWGGGRARRLLQAIYTTAHLCLLRSDEVLKIQAHDMTFYENGVAILLPFRKTHQNGEIKPFFLYALHESEAHLCAVRALADWIVASRISSGYLFRKITSGDRVTETNAPMTSEQFLELFRNNLLDIGVDPAPYGTHSFRRGGCQYLHINKRWSLRRICEWGGWSQELTNLTIVKYLISLSDEPMEPREHYFNPDRCPVVKCPHCGRSCACA
ncbi:DNA breaking-rejoining enzyme [Tylopilus felleus]